MELQEVREELKPTLNKFIIIKYKREEFAKHIYTGKVVKLLKRSLKLQINDEIIVPVGFRNIIAWKFKNY
jgi:hypothetical protein